MNQKRLSLQIGHGEPGVIYFSSGSTGRPKAILLTHENIASNARATAEAFGLRSEDRTVVCYAHGPRLHTDQTDALLTFMSARRWYSLRIFFQPAVVLDLVDRFHATTGMRGSLDARDDVRANVSPFTAIAHTPSAHHGGRAHAGARPVGLVQEVAHALPSSRHTGCPRRHRVRHCVRRPIGPWTRSVRLGRRHPGRGGENRGFRRPIRRGGPERKSCAFAGQT